MLYIAGYRSYESYTSYKPHEFYESYESPQNAMSERKILITGLGAVSAAGENLSETLRTLDSGKRKPEPTTLFETEVDRPVFEARRFQKATTSKARPTSRTAELTLHAAREALAEAGNPHLVSGIRIGVCLGTTVACQLNNLPFYRQYRESGRPDLQPVKDFLSGNLAAVAAAAFACQGPRSTVVNACSSGADAIGTALCWLRAGLCDVAVAGGADELNRVPLCGFNSLGIMSHTPCRPFDRNRDGLNLGEGAGILILETEQSARLRGSESNLRLAGYASSCDAHHLTAPHPEGLGLKLAIKNALADASLRPRDIGFVNAHGTATPDNDQVEGAALKTMFGDEVRYFSTKGLTGHTLGAAGALEAVFTALNLKEGWIPGNAGFTEPDPAIPVPPVTGKMNVNARGALSSSLAFGGSNAALVFCKK